MKNTTFATRLKFTCLMATCCSLSLTGASAATVMWSSTSAGMLTTGPLTANATLTAPTGTNIQSVAGTLINFWESDNKTNPGTLTVAFDMPIADFELDFASISGLGGGTEFGNIMLTFQNGSVVTPSTAAGTMSWTANNNFDEISPGVFSTATIGSGSNQGIGTILFPSLVQNTTSGAYNLGPITGFSFDLIRVNDLNNYTANFSIDGTVVPEPSRSVLLLSGLAIFLLRRRR